ncbi:alpha/beta hydrolase [Denitromonas iodatirespirans]|uniref:Alpha/beta hydrolase n=1 Tax=Denitromonas iodatirespirans TaxID=2795389 RepID=A0A944DA41_DENI1|nr:alpha/beta hydrolase [Denitromonas iodatirespirans]MBT0961321.1 alpha/beta hydrolase [Denitromonas iodatirespirans]
MSLTLRHTTLSLPAGPVWLAARLAHAPDVRALVILARSTLDDDQSASETAICHALNQAGYATLGLDLVTPHEDERDPDLRYNTPLLATRIEAALAWLDHQPPLHDLARGLVTGGTASGAAIRAASRSTDRLHALFCIGGRIDLAGAGPLRALALPLCVAVGQHAPGRAMMHQAYSLIRTEAAWQEIDDTGLSAPATLARIIPVLVRWFDHHLANAAPPTEKAG